MPMSKPRYTAVESQLMISPRWRSASSMPSVLLPEAVGPRIARIGGDEELDNGGYSILGWFELNYLGILTVSIQSLYGDFYFGSGTLTAQGDVVPPLPGGNEVPEPGSMLLLGAALTAAALANRRRKL